MTLDELVGSVAERLRAEGAHAIVLTGSVARGTAKPDSDVDFFVVGEGPSERHEVVEERLVAMHWYTPEEVRRRLADPEQAVLTVRAWKQARILHDPDGVAAELQAEAKRWSWDDISAHADVWAREQVVRWAEYLPKLRRAFEDGRTLDGAALAAETAVKLARVVAVVNRIAADSENGLWETVAEAAPLEWRAAFEQALGGGASRAEGAVRLFELTAQAIEDTLSPEEQAVIAHSLEAASFSRAQAG